ncbi:2OG-Fe(II) oxygenase [Massilia sp. YIM B02443]|uniref:2OG-Fe(II) oxygenase n=1 Tax=Massilia sp. YIM B02443 TaxID=3050127 RepID=UPI0025B6768D|nr:2OG-Fe(II) oxygenase [Massilia sp. YIM B02443]MDN4037568.1 2OG-Fe(II) oxygenase [Massilia sp. YIM B02443]
MDDFIGVYDDALTPQQCDALVARFDASDKVVRGRTGNGVDVVKKDSYDITINGYPEWEDATRLLLASMMRHLVQYVDRYRMMLMGSLSPTLAHPQTGAPTVLTMANFDEIGRGYIEDLVRVLYRPGTINLQKYLQNSGGYHHWHSEIYPQNASCESLHRVLLWMFYLNDVEDGGETEFMYQGRRIAPKKGRLVIAPAGFTHTHKGNVAKSGDKYIATSWILYQRAEALFGQPAT